VIFLFFVTFTLRNYFLADLRVKDHNSSVLEICKLKGNDLPNSGPGSASSKRFNLGNKARGRARHKHATRRKNNLPTCLTHESSAPSSLVDAFLTPQIPLGPANVENFRQGQKGFGNNEVGNNVKPRSLWGLDPKPTSSCSLTPLELNSKSQEPV